MLSLFRRQRRYPVTRYQWELLYCIAASLRCLADQLEQCLDQARDEGNHD